MPLPSHTGFRRYGNRKYYRTRGLGPVVKPYVKMYRSVRSHTGQGMKVLYKNSQNSSTSTPLLPLKKFGKLPYYDNNSFNTGAAVAGGYVFTANGLFDPNITGVGHQPMGFDQMMLFYEHYTVTKCKVTVNFWNTSTTDNVTVGILIAPDTTISTVVSTINENGMLVKRNLSPFVPGADGHKCALTITANISKINGKKDVKSEDDFRGDVASNPTEQTYIQLFGYDQQQIAAKSIAFDIMIEYLAIFTEPRKMIPS